MPTTWTHPQLGTFTLENRWKARIELSAFKVFSHSDVNESAPDGMCPLELGHTTREVSPPSDVIVLLEKLVGNQAQLVTAITHALWEEFNGRGPVSGMWWRGALDQITEHLISDHLSPPMDPAGLLPLMRLVYICICRQPTWNRPLIHLCFGAEFEEEHGVGILTDGEKILGTGYYDVHLYQ